MGLFSFLAFSKSKKQVKATLNQNEYVPFLWEDDYCQIELVPLENKWFIEKQSEQIEDLAKKSQTENGFKDALERGPMPVTTLSKEIRADYLEYLLSGFDFPKAKHIQYDENRIIDCQKSKTKAFGFSNFTIFFEIEEVFVKNLWMQIGLIVSTTQFNLIKEALYILGEESELLLIDWNSCELIDLRDRNQIDKYLMGYWK